MPEKFDLGSVSRSAARGIFKWRSICETAVDVDSGINPSQEPPWNLNVDEKFKQQMQSK